MKPAHIVYVLRSESDPARYYTGVTANLSDRLDAHNSGSTPSTKDGRPWRLVVAIDFADPVRAAEFEAYLKSGSGRPSHFDTFAEESRRVYNTSPLDMKKLMGDQMNIAENLRTYVEGFSREVRDIFESLDFETQRSVVSNNV